MATGGNEKVYERQECLPVDTIFRGAAMLIDTLHMPAHDAVEAVLQLQLHVQALERGERSPFTASAMGNLALSTPASE